MADWAASSPELIARFDDALPLDPRCARRKMFGCPAAFANGRLFACVHADRLVLRLDTDDRETLRRAGALPFEPMPGRVMREYLVAPAALPGDRRRLRRWLEKSFAFTCALPPKPRARRATTPARSLRPRRA